MSNAPVPPRFNGVKSDPIWYQNVRVLFAGDKLREFWPARDQTFEERVNAIVRLIVYAGVALYLYNRDTKYVLYAIACIGVVSYVYSVKAKKGVNESFRDYRRMRADSVAPVQAVPCTLPTDDNPFGNVLLTDLADNPDRPAACYYDDVKADVDDKFNKNLYRNVEDVWGKENSQRQWYTTPNSEAIPDTAGFAQWCFGEGFSKSCKDETKDCWPPVR